MKINSNPATQKLQADILSLLDEIEDKYPELYQHLDELPPMQSDEGTITIEKYESYFDFLKTQLAHHKENHKI